MNLFKPIAGQKELRAVLALVLIGQALAGAAYATLADRPTKADAAYYWVGTWLPLAGLSGVAGLMTLLKQDRAAAALVLFLLILQTAAFLNPEYREGPSDLPVALALAAVEPLAALLALGVLVEAWRQRRTQGMPRGARNG